ncbi:hypothetical protein D5R81_18515 [Parashewanella spongiae]|uniref:Uncharacterized protein n=1 Tax=Parashewanella spongiae TaxID=342950 RepID=A0A3A6TCM0_9GAMM|nr:hypothetical protein [Parashewanella spongiae]MCL1080021.1 hypothetical protein [Parashewanella spongiae]RJY05747.1 hypothetical protein D5R81_18515 [Parashewanella spongiae]
MTPLVNPNLRYFHIPEEKFEQTQLDCWEVSKKLTDEKKAVEFRKLASEMGSLSKRKIPEKLADWSVVNPVLSLSEKDKITAVGGDEHCAKRLSILGDYLLEFGYRFVYYSGIDRQIKDKLQFFFRKTECLKVLELGAGLGWWAKAIHNDTDLFFRRIHVTAIDNGASIAWINKGDVIERNQAYCKAVIEQFEAVTDTDKSKASKKLESLSPKAAASDFNQCVFPVKQMNASTAIAKYKDTHDLLLVVNPVSGITDSLVHWPKDKPVLMIAVKSIVDMVRAGSSDKASIEALDKGSLKSLRVTSYIADHPLKVELFKGFRA